MFPPVMEHRHSHARWQCSSGKSNNLQTGNLHGCIFHGCVYVKLPDGSTIQLIIFGTSPAKIWECNGIMGYMNLMEYQGP